MTVPGPDRAARRDLYRLASRLLASEVDPPLLARLRAAGAAAGGVPLLDPGLLERDEYGALEDLAVEYCRLFIGPEPVCPPYASAHTGGRRLGGRAERDLLAFLEVHGLRPLCAAELSLLGMDHLAVHLAVLAHLHDATGQDPDGADTIRARHELVRQHTMPWAGELVAVLARDARLAPYSTIGAVLEQLLGQEVAEAA